jgi:cellulose synthase operon protein C
MRRVFSLLLLVVLLGGCSSGSFVGQRYDNFTAFYNKFYNARKSFEKGVSSIQRQAQPIDRDRYMTVFPTIERTGSNREFDAAIRRSADVLRHHPDSRWVDDALLLIGQSYFFLHNFVGAEEKFREVISLDSRLDDEARFWLLRTLIASGKYEAAAQALEEGLGNDDVSRRWKPQLLLAGGELSVHRGEFALAADRLADGLDGIRDRELAARASFLLGQVYETLGQHQESVAAFERVMRFTPPYELEYAALYNSTRVLGVHLDMNEGLRRARRLERDDKHFDSRAELVHLRGYIYHANGAIDEAYWSYQDALYGFERTQPVVRSRTHHRLAELFRDHYIDFQLAAAHFDSAAVAAPQRSPQQQQLISTVAPMAPGAISGSREYATMLGSFVTAHDRVKHLDSLLHIGSLSDEDFEAYVLRLREEKARELEAQRREQERREQQARFDNQVERVATPGGGAPAAAAAGRGNFLFNRDVGRMQENRIAFVTRWGERPLVPNWRRQEAVAAAVTGLTADGSANLRAGRAAGRSGEAITLPQVDVSGVPRDAASRERMRVELAEARYNVANVLFLQMNKADSAAVWYRMVVDDSAEFQVAARAFYALAEVQRLAGDSLTAVMLYDTIIERYAGTELADALGQRLGRLPKVVTADTLLLAEAAYEDAAIAWRDERFEEAFRSMLELASSFRNTIVAPRALLAAGILYQEWAVVAGFDALSPLDPSLATIVASLGAREVTDEIVEMSEEELTADPGAQPPDLPTTATLPVAVDTKVGLRDLFSFIVTSFNGSPEAVRASDLVDAIDEAIRMRAEVSDVEETASAEP